MMKLRRGNYKPRRELKRLKLDTICQCRNNAMKILKKKKREENKKKPVADNLSIDTTGMKEVIDYRKKNGTLDGIFKRATKRIYNVW